MIIKNLSKAEKIPTRNGFGEGLVEAATADKRIVALCADLTDSTRTKKFREKFPERFVEIGVAEQNLATVASGMAAAGKIPFITSYAAFSPGRNYEQIRTTIAYNEQPVKIAGAHAGVSVGPDGATHQMIEDISLMRNLPGMTVLVPCDTIETRKATVAAARTKGPVYLRFAREKTSVFTTEKTPFRIGKAEVFRDGKDVAIIAAGPVVYEALLAAEKLSKTIDVAVVNCHTIKPLDQRTIRDVAKKCGAVVTVEEHMASGGLGSAVSEYLSQSYPVPMKIIGINDRFGESGPPDALLEKFGLTAPSIVRNVNNLLRNKWPETVYVEPEVHGDMRQVLGRVEPEKVFHLQSGKKVGNLPELMYALQKMDHRTFNHHVTSKRNDFSSWVKNVLNDSTLAHLLTVHNSKREMVEIIKMRVAFLEKKMGW